MFAPTQAPDEPAWTGKEKLAKNLILVGGGVSHYSPLWHSPFFGGMVFTFNPIRLLGLKTCIGGYFFSGVA